MKPHVPGGRLSLFPAHFFFAAFAASSAALRFFSASIAGGKKPFRNLNGELPEPGVFCERRRRNPQQATGYAESRLFESCRTRHENCDGEEGDDCERAQNEQGPETRVKLNRSDGRFGQILLVLILVALQSHTRLHCA